MFNLTEKDRTRFWDKIQVGTEDECWPWIARSLTVNGYGSFKHTNEKNSPKAIVASRIACYLGHGDPLYNGAFALHSCDNPLCCNPKHLRWGDQKDNVRDAITRGRHSKPPTNYTGRHTGKMPKGEEVTTSSLTEPIVREVWRLHMTGKYNIKQISEMTGANPYPVADLCRGKSWRHLPDAPSIEALKTGGVRRGFNQFSKT
jgi:hypothetical protein